MRTSRGAIMGAIATSLIAVIPALPVAAAPAQQTAAALAEATGTFTPVAPARILDTRAGNGAPTGPVGQGATIDLQVTGRGNIPASGVMAVVLNVTVVDPTSWGHVTVWPTGVARPLASSLNFTPGFVGANSVTVAVGTGGKVSLYNSAGNTHLIADVVGWYASSAAVTSAGLLYTHEPSRHFDSRVHWDEKFLPGDSVILLTDYEVDNPRIKAWVVNVTSTEAETAGFVTLWDGSESGMPLASTLNLVPGRTVPNMAVVPARQCLEAECGIYTGWSSIGVYSSGITHLIVDVFAVYDDGSLGTDGLRFAGNTPTRIVDSRGGLGTPGALGPASTATITTPAELVDENTFGLALNVTAVQPTADTFMTVWPNGLAQPFVSNLNPSAGQIIPNAVVTELDIDYKFNVYNNGGSVHFLVDVVGRFYWLPPTEGVASRSGGTTKVKPAATGVHALQR